MKSSASLFLLIVILLAGMILMRLSSAPEPDWLAAQPVVEDLHEPATEASTGLVGQGATAPVWSVAGRVVHLDFNRRIAPPTVQVLGEPTRVQGVVGRGLELRGPGEHLQIPYPESVPSGTIPGPWTLALWVKIPREGVASPQRQILRVDTLRLELDERARFQLRSGNTRTLASSVAADGVWHHLTLVCCDRECWLFHNGKIVITHDRDQGRWNLPALKSEIVVGGGVRCTVDDVRLYSRALKAHQIWELPELAR